MKRAKYFITVQGKQYNSLKIESEFIRNELLYESGKKGQLKLW